MDKTKIKVIAMDLDGTLTQHKEQLLESQKQTLDRLKSKYKLLMVGAGQVGRIFNQMNKYPIDIIGNYGMQYAIYDEKANDLSIKRDICLEADRKATEKIVTELRQKHGFLNYRGDNVEYHVSGCITFPILGTKALQPDKLSFDPTREKRRAIYKEVCDKFESYNVFVGGSSSFDMAPKPYNKYYALDLYCKENKIQHNEVLYIGDDYGLGGNDESVYLSDIPFLKIDNYLDFPTLTEFLLEE